MERQVKFLRYTPVLNRKEEAACTRAFNAFAKEGILDPKEMMEYMTLLKFNEREPVIFGILQKFADEHKGGAKAEEFLDSLNKYLQDRESDDTIQDAYDLFVEDPKGKVDFEVLKKVTKEVGDDDSDEKLKKMIEGAARNEKDVDFDEFHEIMTKNVKLVE